MSNLIEVRLEGFVELQEQFLALDQSVRQHVLVETVEKVAGSLVPSMQSEVPVYSGNLQASIDFVARNYEQDAVAVAYIGPTDPLGRHAHLVARGTKPRYTRRGKYSGMMPADPFVERTYDANVARMEQAVAQELATQIQREARR